jgi:GxxExxY protein
MLHDDITESMIKAIYKVYNSIGYGFLLNVYENSMRIELLKMGLTVEQQKNIRVYYE